MRVLLTVVLALVLVATGCSGGDEQPSVPASSGPSSAEPSTAPAVRPRVRIGEVVGSRLPPARRAAVKRQVGRVVDRWFEAAYGGDYPRRGFDKAFPDFTLGARDRARRDRKLMSNADIGRRIDGVEMRRKDVRVDVLSVRRRARAATARFLLRFRTTGQADRRVTVRGRLMLTRRPAGWKVFGYDVAKGAR